jgi:N-acetylglucosamine malate deacetylase 1
MTFHHSTERTLRPDDIAAKIRSIVRLAWALLLFLGLAVSARAEDSRPAIAVVTAHPDDLESGVGGTLLRVKDRFAIHLFIASKGERGMKDGRKGISDEPIAATGELREKEARAAADMLGATLTFIGEIDGAIFPNKEACARLGEHLRKLRPVAVITMWQIDVADHAAAGHMALRALWDTKLLWGLDFLYFGVSSDGRPGTFQPDFYVPVDGVYEAKRALIRCHVCQNTDDVIVKHAEKRDALHGAQVGVPFAEGFKSYHPFAEARGKKRPFLNALIELGVKFPE